MNHAPLLRNLLIAGLLCGPGLAGRPAMADKAEEEIQKDIETLESLESAAAHAPKIVIKPGEDDDSLVIGGSYGKGLGIQGGKDGKNGAGRGGLILYDQFRDNEQGGLTGDSVTSSEVPDQYVVEKGDTLWSICARFFQNSYYWPKLWSFNDAITNPHWIYPGDLITMHAPGRGPAAPATAKQEEPRRMFARNSTTMPSGLFLRQNGFVEPGELDSAGVITGSREEKIMLASLDEIYIEMNKKKPLRVKGRYTIYKTIKSVRRPYGDKAYLGEVVEILGDVEVKQITSGGIARAVISEAFGAVERGFRVGPLRRTYKLVDARQNKNSLDAVVVAALQQSVMLDTQMLTFVDLGRQTGIEVGNRLYAIRRGDAYPGLLAKPPSVGEDRRFPKEVVAEITVVDVRDNISAGLITRSVREIRVGDKVEARKGF